MKKKIVIIAGISILVVIIVISITILMLKTEPIINQNTYFTGNNFTLSILNSYLTNTDYKGNIITNNYYLIVKINIKSNTSAKHALDIATTKILIVNYVYTPITQYKDSFSDFGYVYQGENLSEEYEEKILVYELPKEMIDKDIIFSYVDKNKTDKKGEFKSTKIRINYQELFGVNESNINLLNNELDFNSSIIGDVKLKISAFDIQKKYKLN